MRWLAILLLLTGGLALAAPREERILFSKASTFNGKVLVVEEGPYRILRFVDEGRATEQSRCEARRPDFLCLEYSRLQLLGLCFASKHSRVLVVGLGGGSLSKALAHMLTEARVDSVEIDPVVVEAARGYFGYRDSPRVQTFVADARDYLARTRETYDVVFLDAFDGLDVPLALRTLEFYRSLSERLTAQGVVVANFHRNSHTYSSDLQTLATVFPRTYLFGGLGNVLVVGLKEPQERLPLEELVKRAGELTREYDLGKYARQLLPDREWDTSAPLVHDP